MSSSTIWTKDVSVTFHTVPGAHLYEAVLEKHRAAFGATHVRIEVNGKTLLATFVWEEQPALDLEYVWNQAHSDLAELGGAVLT